MNTTTLFLVALVGLKCCCSPTRSPKVPNATRLSKRPKNPRFGRGCAVQFRPHSLLTALSNYVVVIVINGDARSSLLSLLPPHLIHSTTKHPLASSSLRKIRSRSLHPPYPSPEQDSLRRSGRGCCGEGRSAEDDASEEDAAAAENLKRKLFVGNLPWSLTVLDIKKLFSDCGTVVDVEYIKQKDGSGKSRGFSFVTMESADQAQAVVDKFDSTEVSGRIVRVQFAKSFKKPPPPRPAGAPLPGETRHKIYVSNLAWKARSNHLRELFAAKVKPVSTKVVFENSSSRSSGYGFVSFASREEAEIALSTFDGQELLGRPLRLRFSERTDDATTDEKKAESGPGKEEPPQESYVE